MPNRNIESEIGNINRRMPFVSFIRRPTSADIRNPETGRIYARPYFWRVKLKPDGSAPDTGSEGELWYLEDITANVADWKQLVFSLGTTGIISITGDAGGAVTGDGGGDMDLNGLVVSSGTRAKPVFFTGTPGSNKQELEVQVASDRTGAPLNTLDVGLCSFDDTAFSVNALGYVSLVGGGVTPPTMKYDIDTNTAPGVDPTIPTALGIVGIKGAVVAAHSVPIETHARAVNEFNIEVQVGAAVTGAPGTKDAAGLVQFDDTSFAVDADGYVTFTGALGTHIDTLTGDSGGAVGPDGAGDVDLTGLTVANATNAKPLFVKGGTNAQVVEVQIATEVTGAPADMLDAGIASYNDTQFAVDANGYVTLVGATDKPSVQTLTGDDAVATGPDANGDIDLTGLAVANATNAKPVYVNGGTNSEVVEVQVATEITGAPVDKNDAGLASFNDTQFTVDANGYVALVGGTDLPVAQTITGDSGGALNPDANGNWNILGLGETSTSGSGSTLSILSPRCAEFVVDAAANEGTHTTIASALSAASDGDVIFIRPGTYTENLTGKDGVRLTAFTGDGRDGTVEIVGKLTLSSGFMVLNGIKLTTNLDYFVAASGTASLELQNCFLNVADNDGISMSSSGSITCRMCQGDVATTGVKFFAVTAGTLSFRYCNSSNSGATVTASTVSAGTVNFRSCEMPMQMSATSTGTISLNNTRMDTSANNVAVITTAGTGISEVTNCELASGTASTVSIGSGTTVIINDAKLESSNTNTVTGAGTLQYAGLALSGTSSAINPTTATAIDYLPGRISFDEGTNYLENYAEGTFTPELTGSGGAPTITYTTQLGKYTRIGNRVDLKVFIDINTFSGGSGNAQLTTLPFTSANDSIIQTGTAKLTGVGWDAGANYIVSQINSNDTVIYLAEITDNAAGGTVAITDFAAGDTVLLNITYWV